MASVISCTELLSGPARGVRPLASDDRPVVVWNSTRRCNLACRHCYLRAGEPAADDGRPELTAAEAAAFVEDLAAMGAPVLLVSGGEPLLRPDIFSLGDLAVARGLRAALSTNGTLIDGPTARRIARAGFSYVGVSLDGLEPTHDRFRGADGAFRAALEGIRRCLAAGVRAGVRMTLTRDNFAELPAVLELVEREAIPRLCLYHLVYSGRGAELAGRDLSAAESRAAMELVARSALDWHRRGVAVEVLTVDNHADGIFMEGIFRGQRSGAGQPGRHDEPGETGDGAASEPPRRERRHGGCSAGRRLACVDHLGDVRPCQFWSAAVLGNVRERPFSRIWADGSHPLLARLRAMPAPLSGPRCSACRHRELCGGCRVRAEAAGGDPWGDDPACYLSDAEIGLGAPEAARR